MKPSARWALLVVSLAAIVVLFLTLRPAAEPEPAATASTPVATTTPSETDGTSSPSPTPMATPDVVEIEIEIEDGRIDARSEYAASVGERVRIEVAADLTDHVHVHGYDLLADVAPEDPAVITFRADATGVFEVELEEDGRLLFRLRVTP